MSTDAHDQISGYEMNVSSGITKREYFAAAALTAMSRGVQMWTKDSVERCAADSVALADALIAALNEVQP